MQRLKECDNAGVDREFKMIDDLERGSESEYRSLVRLLSTGSFFGGIREDLLSLLGYIDRISHASKHSALVFYDMKPPKDVIDYFFQEDVGSFISSCIDAARLLKESVNALQRNKEEVLSFAEKVGEKETEADSKQHSIVRHLYKNEINAKSLDIVTLRDFLHLADNIADNSENGSDVLVILVAKGYS